jgi:hypothetical protein
MKGTRAYETVARGKKRAKMRRQQTITFYGNPIKRDKRFYYGPIRFIRLSPYLAILNSFGIL